MKVIDGLLAHGEDGNAAVEREVREEVGALVRKFPIYD
jgi:glycine hydroxymethyltransferase